MIDYETAARLPRCDVLRLLRRHGTRHTFAAFSRARSAFGVLRLIANTMLLLERENNELPNEAVDEIIQAASNQTKKSTPRFQGAPSQPRAMA